MKIVKIKAVGGHDALCEAIRFICDFNQNYAAERDYGPEHGVMYTGTHINVLVYHTKTMSVADARGIGQPSNGGQGQMKSDTKRFKGNCTNVGVDDG